MISIRRKDSGVGSVWYKQSDATSVGCPGNDVSPMAAPERTDESTTDSMMLNGLGLRPY